MAVHLQTNLMKRNAQYYGHTPIEQLLDVRVLTRAQNASVELIVRNRFVPSLCSCLILLPVSGTSGVGREGNEGD